MIHARHDYMRFQDPLTEKPTYNEALAFAKSVILSGELWTEKCEEIIGAALERSKTQQVLGEGSTPIGIDEPVMLFRAKDKHFRAVIAYYAALIAADDENDTAEKAKNAARMCLAIEGLTDRAIFWESQNSTKAPDMPAISERQETSE